MEQGRYYQVVFLWMKDPAKFARYLQLAAPVVGRYGGALERMLLPDTIHGEGVRLPDVVNVVSYDGREAFAALGRDPEFREVVPLRTESVDMISVEGMPCGGELSEDRSERRSYLLELARFGAGGEAGYDAYEAAAEPVMRPYGYHVERVVAPDARSGFPFEVDRVKVAYFETPEGLDRLHADPAHPRLERELYPAAVAQSLWVTGRIHPATLATRP